MILKIISSVTVLFSVSCLASAVSKTPLSFQEELSLLQDNDDDVADPMSAPWAPAEGSIESDVSTPDDLQTSPEGTTETYSQSCLTLETAGCVDMNTLDLGKVLIPLPPPEERSVTSCVNLCSKKRPGSSVIYAVWITTGDPQRLLCGCDYSLTGRLVSEDLCSLRCPGDGRRCGALVNKVFSVYTLLGDVVTGESGNPILCSTEATVVSTTDSSVTTTPLPGTPGPPLLTFPSFVPPTGLPPELPPASDFEFLGCFREDGLFDDRMYIEHVDHRYRSVSSCFRVCQKLHPPTAVVYTKMIEMDERLVCGCDARSKDRIPLRERVEATYCDEECPDGGGSCGSLRNLVVSAYSEEETSRERTTSGPGSSAEATSGRSWCVLGALAVIALQIGS